MDTTEAIPIDEQLADFFRALSQPVRIQILAMLGAREACVSHLEAYLGLRQSAISQHLIILKDAGLVGSTREGRNVFYHLAHPGVLDLLDQAALLQGIPAGSSLQPSQPVYPCPCPLCCPGSPNSD
jgi:DNA-binding transcriptional ArsR family regulator